MSERTWEDASKYDTGFGILRNDTVEKVLPLNFFLSHFIVHMK